MWDETVELELNKSLRKHIIIQWWQGWKPSSLYGAFQGGFAGTLQSSGWYLDYADDWKKMIQVRVWEETLGGEACSWSEQSDGVVLDDLFRRIPAVMERLWSNTTFTNGFRRGTLPEYPTTLRLAR